MSVLTIANIVITIYAVVISFAESVKSLKLFSYRVLAAYGVASLFYLIWLFSIGDYQPLGKALGFFVGSVSGPLVFTILAILIKRKRVVSA
jgi:hypothetical protein